MKKLISLLVEFFLNFWKFFFGTSRTSMEKEVRPKGGAMIIKSPLPTLIPSQVAPLWGTNPMFFPKHTGFKPSMREQHLGRRRSRFYFNKNR